MGDLLSDLHRTGQGPAAGLMGFTFAFAAALEIMLCRCFGGMTGMRMTLQPEPRSRAWHLEILPQEVGTVHLPFYMLCDSLCLSGKTYVLEGVDGVWQVTGSVGAEVEG